jgi:adenylyl-sulfate kinase
MKTENIKPFCIWLTGLSGSGKTSIAKSLQIQLERMGKASILLDGDEVRKSISSDLRFTEEDRKENARRIAHIAKLIYQNNISSIVSTISPYKISREYARSIFPENSFIEVYVSTSIEVCKKRNTKKLYEAASLGNLNNFTGIDMPYEVSDNFDIEINTLEINIDESVDKIMKHINTNLI